jgi:hypothetical protein
LIASPSLTPCKFCLKYILDCVFVRYHLNPCHPSIFTLILITYLHFKAACPISFQEWRLTRPALVCSLFLGHAASLALTRSFGVFFLVISLTFVISRSFHDAYPMPTFWNIIFPISIWEWCFTYPDLGCLLSRSVTILALAPSFIMLMPLPSMSYYSPCLLLALE